MKRFYITTAIDYINGKPHLGHAYEKIGADVLKRYKNMVGIQTTLLVGTDEHSTNVLKSAHSLGLEPKAYCDNMASQFRELCRVLNISFDRFIRTTDDDHIAVVQNAVETLWNKGFIRKDSYSGLYCESCEAFLQKDQLLDGLCPNHPSKKVAWVNEENYFFTLSYFQNRLEQHIEENPEFIEPETRRNEIKNRLKEGLRDISISRSSNSHWGIPFPQDHNHTVYVWFDALLNYLTGSGYLFDEAAYQTTWPADVHIVGKDITWFHCVIWPSILLALQLPLPRKIFGHGFINLKGEKLSKSSGVVLDPFELIEQYSADVIRFYLMRVVPWGQDGNFSLEGLVTTYNNDLANDFGNLISRTTAMINKFSNGHIPVPTKQNSFANELGKEAENAISKYHNFMERMQFADALSEVISFVGKGNRYIDESAPWQLFKDEKYNELSLVLYSLVEVIRISTWMLQPFMPSLKNRVWLQLGFEQAIEEQVNCSIWGCTYEKIIINRGAPLFPRW